MLWWKNAHKTFAYLFLLLAETTVAFGIYWYHKNKCWKTYLHWFHLLAFFIPLATLEILHRVVWLKQKISLTPKNEEISKKNMTMTP